MVAEAKGPLNFNAFIKLFEDKLNGTDEESKLVEAFKVFDMSASGSLAMDALKEMLTQNGRPSDRLSDAEFKQVMEGAPVEGNKVNYAGFASLIKNGK